MSSSLVVPFCGASGGLVNEPTVIEWGLPSTGTVVSVFFGFSWYTVSCVPEPQMSGHSMSDMAMT